MPHMSVGEKIALVPRIAGAPVPDVAGLLEMVDRARLAAGRRPRCRGASSSGSVWRARWRPARGLMLLDEPFGVLDPVTRDALGRRYRELHDRLGLTPTATHDTAVALLLADRILVMAKGRIVGDATPRGCSPERRGRRPTRWWRCRRGRRADRGVVR